MIFYVVIFISLFNKGSPRIAEDTNPVIVARIGVPIVLSLRVVAFPLPHRFTWSRNITGIWEDLTQSVDYVITRKDLEFNLTLTNVTREDSGEYVLQIDNGVGAGFSFVFFLQIRGKIYD